MLSNEAELTFDVPEAVRSQKPEVMITSNTHLVELSFKNKEKSWFCSLHHNSSLMTARKFKGIILNNSSSILFLRSFQL